MFNHKTYTIMGAVKPYTQEELEQMREMRKQGATYKEIADMFGRTENAVMVKFSQMGWSVTNPSKAKRLQAEQPKELTTVPDKLVRKLQLSDFEPREMIKYLYNLGYRIKNNKLVFVTEKVVNMKAVLEDD